MYHAALSTVAAEGAADGYEWKFELGQCVTHVDQPMPSLVMWRTKNDTHELYGVRSFLDKDTMRDRMILDGSLRAAVPHSEDCGACLLYNTGLCPGLLDLLEEA